MLRNVNFYSICFIFGVCVFLILAGSRYTDNTNCSFTESRRNKTVFERIKDGEEILPQISSIIPNDGSPNIDKILENTREKIKFELSYYNFTYSGAKNLQDLLLESGGKPLRSLIISTWRSGSTFLGDILNAMPGNFYHYEPFFKDRIIQIRGPPLAGKALNTIKGMFNCDFNKMEDYFEFGKRDLYQFSHNTRLWEQCKYKKELCFDANFTSKICKLFPFQSMKIVRFRLHLVRDILEDHKLNVKVVLLIRDPRGVMQSRQHRGFCRPAPDCSQPELLCADMISDYMAARKLQQQYPNRLIVVRFEELALELNSTTQRLYKFLGLNVMPPVYEFLRSHSNVEVLGVHSTFRITRDVPFKWKNILDYDSVEKIQVACKQAMALWGYRLARNASHQASKEFYPLEKISIIRN